MIACADAARRARSVKALLALICVLPWRICIYDAIAFEALQICVKPHRIAIHDEIVASVQNLVDNLTVWL